MEMEARQDDLLVDQDAAQRGFAAGSPSSRFPFFNSGSGSRLEIGKGPPSPEEIVTRLNDDPFLMKPLVSGDGFSLDDVYRYFTSFTTNEGFNAAISEIASQMRRLSIIDSLATSTCASLPSLVRSSRTQTRIVTRQFPNDTSLVTPPLFSEQNISMRSHRFHRRRAGTSRRSPEELRG
jgi:hypothetical protein